LFIQFDVSLSVARRTSLTPCRRRPEC